MLEELYLCLLPSVCKEESCSAKTQPSCCGRVYRCVKNMFCFWLTIQVGSDGYHQPRNVELALGVAGSNIKVSCFAPPSAPPSLGYPYS